MGAGCLDAAGAGGIGADFLGILGGIAAKTGGAPILPGVARILIWSALAMAVSSGVGMLFGVAAG